MKNLFCCILVVGSVSAILGSNNNNGINSGSYVFNQDFKMNQDKIDYLLNKNGDMGDDYDKNLGVLERKAFHKFQFDDGNPDVHGNIERPCQVYDTFCIRKFFAEHSKCKISGRRLPNPFYRAQGTVNYPSANMSASAPQSTYTGLHNGRIEEFYINTVTDNLVIAIYFDDVNQASNFTNLKFYLRGREPEIHVGFGSLAFLQLTITAVIPGLQDLQLDRAEITVYANNPILPFVVSPALASTTNPEVLAMSTYFLTAGLPIEHLEELSTEAIFFLANYIQYNICDFGLKVL